MDLVLSRAPGQLALDAAIAASFVVAALRAGGHGGAAAWIVAAVQFAMGAAVLCRGPERRAATTTDWLAAVPSLTVAAAVFAAANDGEWRAGPLAAVALGGAIALSGLRSLGRSFAVFPGVRQLRTGGAYRWVRHPIYLGELLVLAGAAARLGWPGAVGMVAVLPLVAWRIRVEERMLADEPGWAAWAARVRWRLLPGLW